MEKVIIIDENARIKIISENFMLQYKIKTRNKRIAWHTDGFFSDLMSLSEEYLNSAPYRAIQATEDFEKLIKVIKVAEANLRKAIEKNNQ
jgi:hypothetical protein